HDGVVHHDFRTDAADQGFAGGNTDSKIDFGRYDAHAQQFREFLAELDNSFNDFDCRGARELSLVCFLDEWRAPIRHDCITDIFIDNASMLADRLRHGRQIAIHDLHEALRRHPCAEICEPLHFAKHHSHHATLALGGGEFGLVNQSFHDARVDISAEGLADALFMTQLLDHPIEGGGQLANFVGRDDFDRSIEVAGLDFARALQQ